MRIRRATASGREFVSPLPSGRCIVTTSSQRPNLMPADFIVPTIWKPRLACTPIEPTFSEVADHRDHLPQPGRGRQFDQPRTSALPTPWPRTSSRT